MQIDQRSSATITYIGHATVLIEMDGVRLMTDPVLRNGLLHLRRKPQEIDPAWAQELDAVLISHAHWDHLDIPSLKMLDPDTLFIVPDGVDDILRRTGFENIQTLSVGDIIDIGSVRVEAVHAEHEGHRLPFFSDEESIGFLIDGSYEIYFAGDTDIFPEMVEISDDLDIALLPVWGWGPSLSKGHLNPYRAAVATGLLKPKIAIPIHWGTLYPIGLNLFMADLLTQPPIGFKRFVSKLAPGVTVNILLPGETFELDGDL